MSSSPEVGRDHQRIAPHLGGLPFGDLDTEVEHHDVVAHAHHEVHVVLDEQHRHPPVVGQSPHEASQLGSLEVAETGSRLVEQQDARLRRDRTGDRQQAAFAIGEVLHLAQQIALEVELADGRHDLARQRRSHRVHKIAEEGEPVARVGRGAEVVEHGEVLEQLERLERPAHPGPSPPGGAQPEHFLTLESNAASCGPGEPGDGVDHRRLAGAVRADEADDAPGRDAERHVLHGHDTAVPHPQSLHLEGLRRRPLTSLLRQHERLRLALGKPGQLGLQLLTQPRDLVHRLLGDAVLVLQARAGSRAHRR